MSGEFVYDETGGKPVSQSYFREKAAEFQQIVNALDATGRELDSLIGALPEGPMLDELLIQFEALQNKKGMIKTIAEGINLAVNGLNQLGGNFPSIQLPQTLGAVPLLVPAAAAAAIFAAASIIVWGREWILGVNQRLRDQQLLASVPEAQRGAVAEAILKTDVALAQADQSPLTSVAGVVKWVAIGAIAFFAYQALQQYRGGE